MRHIQILIGATFLTIAFHSPVWSALHIADIPDITHVRTNENNTNYFNSPLLYIGYNLPFCEPFGPWDTTPHYCASFKSRILIRLTENIPDISPDQIERVSLFLFLKETRSSYPIRTDVHPIITDWMPETVTWLSQPIRDTSLFHVYLTPLSWNEIDITQWYKTMMKNPEGHFGLELKAHEEAVTGAVLISPLCKENDDPLCSTHLAPHLVIETSAPQEDSISITPLSPMHTETIPSDTVTFAWSYSGTTSCSGSAELTILDTRSSIIDSIPLAPDSVEHTHIFSHEDTFFWIITCTTPDTVISTTPQLFTVLSSSDQDTAPPSDNDDDDDIENPDVDLDSDQFYSQPELDHDNNNHDNNLETTSAKRVLPIPSPTVPTIVSPEPHIIKQNQRTTSTEPIPGSNCSVNFYTREKSYSVTACTISKPIVLQSTHTKTASHIFQINAHVQIPTKLTVWIQHTDCLQRVLFFPMSVLGCKNTTTSLTKHTVTPHTTVRFNTHHATTVNHTQQADIAIITATPPTNLSGTHMTVQLEQRASIPIDGTWIDIHATAVSDAYTVPEAKLIRDPNKQFRFPFNKPIGVTQWHGYTAFQSPHTGIDFGAVHEQIWSPADGTVQRVGWDNYYGPCLSGGNYINIRHDNGKHTVYMHLKNYNKSNGIPWKTGDRVREGEQIGITGNTGAWNCQSLGHHLHWEVRTHSLQSSHVNPVPLTDIDWNTIPTLGWRTNPGRLTGDNPHPNF